MNSQVGKEIGGLSSQGRNSRIGIGSESRRVAQVASDLREERLAFRNRRSATWLGARRRRRGQETHERSEHLDIAQNRERLGGIGRVRAVVGRGYGRGEEATFFALRLEELVGNAHFDVVSLSGEDQQRFVLCLPSEPGYGSVVAIVVGVAHDSTLLGVRITGNHDVQLSLDLHPGFGWCFLGEIREDVGVANLLHEPATKDGGRNSKNDIVRGRKIGLGEVARGGHAAHAVDGENIMHPAVRRAFRSLLKSDFARWSIGRNERWNGIRPVIRSGRELILRIHLCTRYDATSHVSSPGP